MPSSIDYRRDGLVALTRDSLLALRTALFRDLGGSAAGYLQDAGYAGAAALYAAFGAWLQQHGHAAPDALPSSQYASRLSEFFRDAGWGSIAVEPLAGALAIDSSDWAEADPANPLEFPGCYYTAGMLADLFGRLADAPVAVMEVECRTMGHDRCRFLVGSAETIQRVYDSMGQGVGYAEALTA
jgi:predicted hydrocarbon binding protein